MDQWKLLKDWYNSFSLIFPVQMKTAIYKAVHVYIPTPHPQPHQKETTFHGLYILKIVHAKSL